MPSCTCSGTASRTSLNACFAAVIRDWPSMSRVRMEPLTSSTSSTLGEALAGVSSAEAGSTEPSPAVRVASRMPTPTVSLLLMIIAG